MHSHHFALPSNHLRSAFNDGVAAFPPPPAPATDNVNIVSQAATTIFLVLLVVLLVTGYLLIYFRNAFAHACCGIDPGDPDHHQRGGGGRRPGLSRTVIETLPIYLYSDVRGHRLVNGELECAVCLNEFKDHELLRLLPSCSHVFHPHCIDTWLVSQATCPLCRSHVESCMDLSDFEDVRSNLDVSDAGDPIDIERSPILTSSGPAEPMQTGRGNVPKSHSTGHSPVWMAGESDRFTLTLPEEVRNKFAMTNGCRHLSNGRRLALMSSPRRWYRLYSGRWCNRERSHRFAPGNVLNRSENTVDSTNFVSRSGSPKSDGPVDYSSLVNDRNHSSQL